MNNELGDFYQFLIVKVIKRKIHEIITRVVFRA